MSSRHTMHVVALTLVVLTGMLVSACGSSPAPTPAPTPTVQPSLTVPPPPTAFPPTPTPLPVATATPVPPPASPAATATATPVPPQVTTTQDVTLRQGPGVQFAAAGKMPNNSHAGILGKSEDGKWFQIAFPDKDHPAWISVAFVTVVGAAEQLPVVAVSS